MCRITATDASGAATKIACISSSTPSAAQAALDAPVDEQMWAELQRNKQASAKQFERCQQIATQYQSLVTHLKNDEVMASLEHRDADFWGSLASSLREIHSDAQEQSTAIAEQQNQYMKVLSYASELLEEGVSQKTCNAVSDPSARDNTKARSELQVVLNAPVDDQTWAELQQKKQHAAKQVERYQNTVQRYQSLMSQLKSDEASHEHEHVSYLEDFGTNLREIHDDAQKHSMEITKQQKDYMNLLSYAKSFMIADVSDNLAHHVIDWFEAPVTMPKPKTWEICD